MNSVIDLAAFKAKANIDKALLELRTPQSDTDAGYPVHPSIHAVVNNLEAA